MGHQRLGTLPAHRLLPEIVRYLVTGGTPTEDLVDQVTDVSRDALKLAVNDPVFIEALWLLVRVPQAAASKNFQAALAELGVTGVTLPSLSDVLVSYDRALERFSANHTSVQPILAKLPVARGWRPSGWKCEEHCRPFGLRRLLICSCLLRCSRGRSSSPHYPHEIAVPRPNGPANQPIASRTSAGQRWTVGAGRAVSLARRNGRAVRPTHTSSSPRCLRRRSAPALV